MMLGTLEEVIDDNHAIVSTAVGPEYYVTIMSFVDKVFFCFVSPFPLLKSRLLYRIKLNLDAPFFYIIRSFPSLV